MKIARLSWQSYKGLTDGTIVTNGGDVMISGRNGSGKSTIAGLLTFVLFGRVTGAAKKYDGCGATIATITPAAEVEFDDGTTLRREVGKENRARLYINGESVTASKFDAFVENYTRGAGMMIINPFEFANQHWREQRNYLLRNFGQAELKIAGESADVFKSKCATELKTLRREALGIPYQIEELERQLIDLPPSTVEEIAGRIAAKTLELSKLQGLSTGAELIRARQELTGLNREKTLVERELATNRARRERLLKNYHELGAACPLCGSVMTAAKLQAARAPIVTEGKAIANEIAGLEKQLTRLEEQIGAAWQKVSELEATYPAELEQTKATLQAELSALQRDNVTMSNAAKIRNRIETLSATERKLNERITALEGQLAQAEAMQWRQMQKSEASVNEQFEHVTFKLYRKQANGEVKETCEAMLDGVPYSSLSKGEKFKAGLDILRTLQRKFGLEMPLMIDDAESYTAGSFIELENQLWLFKVTEGELKIAVMERRQAA